MSFYYLFTVRVKLTQFQTSLFELGDQKLHWGFVYMRLKIKHSSKLSIYSEYIGYTVSLRANANKWEKFWIGCNLQSGFE